MSESGRSAIPTERPSSIQKPIPSSVVRSSSETRDEHAEPGGIATRALGEGARLHGSRPGREASVDIYLAAQERADDPLAGLGDRREARVAGQGREAGRDRRARREGEDLGRPSRADACTTPRPASGRPRCTPVPQRFQLGLAAAGLDRLRDGAVEVGLGLDALAGQVELVDVLDHERRRRARRSTTRSAGGGDTPQRAPRRRDEPHPPGAGQHAHERGGQRDVAQVAGEARLGHRRRRRPSARCRSRPSRASGRPRGA